MEKPKVAGKSPQMVELETGKNYAWCACGKSANQPWCDGSHQGSSFSPKVFTVDEPKTAAICMCKQTKNPPYCDGSHMSLEE
jgi:CDGSH-type Zn-finger protein